MSTELKLQEQKLIRRALYVGASSCALLATLLCPCVLGPVAAPDGGIEDTTTRALLWLAAIAMGIAGISLMWMARSRSRGARAARSQFGNWLELGWNRRYWLGASVLCAFVVASASLGFYVYRVNHVDLVARLDPHHQASQQILYIAKHDGRSAARRMLARSQRSRPRAVCFTPYQLWNKSPEISAGKRRDFLAGDIGKAASINDGAQWRPGDSIPYGHRNEVTRSFSLQCQSFLFDVLRDENAIDFPAALASASAFVKEWRRTNLLWPNTRRFAWNDHATSTRIVAHMLLMDQRRTRGQTSEEEEAVFLASLLQHADQLMDDALYTSGTNHGMIQNVALLAIAIGYPEFDTYRNWQRTAVARTERYARESFTEEGVCLELTPDYHWFNTELLLWFVATCHREKIEIDPSVEQVTRRALRFCKELLQPDGSLPIIADSHGHCRSLANWPHSELPDWQEIRELRDATNLTTSLPNMPGARLWPAAGYFILRSGAPRWTADTAMMLVLKTASKSRAHSHRDSLSIALYGNGRPLLSGPGYPDYEPDTNRSAVYTTMNQNTVSVDGQSQELGNAPVSFCTIKSQTEQEGTVPELAVVQAEASLYPGVQHRRTLFYGPSRTGICIVDELTSAEEHVYRQHFRIAPGLTAVANPTGLRVSSLSDAETLLNIVACVISNDLVEVPKVESIGSVSAFRARGRSLTFVTLVELQNSTGHPPIDVHGRLVKWQGPSGTIVLELPLTDRTQYRWTPNTVEIAKRGRERSLTDSFEGTPPTGWDSGWDVVNFGNSTHDTSSAGGTPPGGGTYAYRQAWDNSSGRPGWLRYYYDTADTGEGDLIEFDYWMKYHANFNYNETWNKSIVMRGGGGAKQEFIIDSFHANGKMYAVFPLTTDTGNLYSNINGGQYEVPLGEWVHYRWQFKISTATNGDPRNGYLYGWVNGTKRWEYDNLNTIHTGYYNEINLNTTFNDTLFGPNQERYWDLFNIRVIVP